jgi:hypothetical protein
MSEGKITKRDVSMLLKKTDKDREYANRDYRYARSI